MRYLPTPLISDKDIDKLYNKELTFQPGQWIELPLSHGKKSRWVGLSPACQVIWACHDHSNNHQNFRLMTESLKNLKIERDKHIK